MKRLKKSLCSKRTAVNLIGLSSIIVLVSMIGVYGYHYLAHSADKFSIQSQILLFIAGILLLKRPLKGHITHWRRLLLVLIGYVLLSYVPVGLRDIGGWVDYFFQNTFYGDNLTGVSSGSSPITRLGVLLLLIASLLCPKIKNGINVFYALVGAVVSIQTINLLSYIVEGSSVLHQGTSVEVILLTLAYSIALLFKSSWKFPIRYALRDPSTRRMQLFAWNSIWAVPVIMLIGAHIFSPTDFEPRPQFYFLSTIGAWAYYIILAHFNTTVALTRTRLEIKSQKMHKLAVTDYMTGAPNRAGLREFKDQHRSTPMSLIVFDIDHFKNVNDRYGHDTGDHVIRTVSRTLQKSLRISDPFVRLGGEEFLVMLPNTSIEDAEAVAEMLRVQVSELDPENDLSILGPITVSCGVSDYAPRQEHFDDAHRRADKALYVSKRNGRNRTTVLAKASFNIIENFKRPVIYGQEIRDMRTETATAIELLARIPGVDPELWFMSAPTDTIAALFNDQLAIARDVHRSTGLMPTINIDSDLFNTLDWDEIAQFICDTPIGFEITHIKGLPGPNKVAAARLALPRTALLLFDDYEPRHESILEQYSVDIVKIDRNYVKLDPQSAACSVENIVNSGKRVIVEGIDPEDSELEQMFIEAGAEFIQGFKYHKPECIHDYMYNK